MELIPPLVARQQTAFDLASQRPTYVLQLVPSPHDADLFVAVSSDKTIKVYRKGTLAMQKNLSGHSTQVVGVGFSITDPDALWSCDRSGKIIHWSLSSGKGDVLDIVRTASPICFCVSPCGQYLLLGTERRGEDAFVELRHAQNGSLIATFAESHSDDVMAVAFSTQPSTIFASCSTDGLVNIYDQTLLEGAEDPEDAILLTLNAESSVSRIGFFGPKQEFLYGVTTDEALLLWHAVEQPGDKPELIKAYPTMRQLLSDQGVPTDYVIDCIFSPDNGRLFVATGNHEGLLAISHVGVDTVALARVLMHGHRATVRCILADFQNMCFVTGAEDSLMIRWSTQATSQVDTSTGVDDQESTRAASGSKVRAEASRSKALRKSTKPY